LSKGTEQGKIISTLSSRAAEHREPHAALQWRVCDSWSAVWKGQRLDCNTTMFQKQLTFCIDFLKAKY